MVGAANDGDVVTGDGNALGGNSSRKATHDGFLVSGSNNIISGNKAAKSGNLGLEDTAGPGANDYSFNNFQTSNLDP